MRTMPSEIRGEAAPGWAAEMLARSRAQHPETTENSVRLFRFIVSSFPVLARGAA
jgi:hypothetical protein